MDRRRRLLRHRSHLPTLRVAPPQPWQEAKERQQEATVRYYDALLKIKEELMLLGFISLLLSVFQGTAQKICVRESVMHHMLPCPLPSASAGGAKYGAAMFTGVLGGARRLLAGGGAADDYCLRKFDT
ncbi:hypothetical protein BAE44_0018461 [Dichanthelium oligosanthes]|uniref:Uncharacterized protein n=1 Tax=Dichanthelium oligosanthes TaxID=888268 RepID=A0A1E5V5T3_9POAL|nr:hypothetical protein BAE44_0018461 [Dichanthelium oligosanthes]